MKRIGITLAVLAVACLGALLDRAFQPEPVCSKVVAVPYKTGERPVCIIHRYKEPS